MTALSNDTVAALDPAVAVPSYDRSTLVPGIVHFGVGGFHRAHQAMVLDRLLATGAATEGICGVGVLPQDRRMAEVMAAQDCLYTLVLKHPDGALEPRVIGSICEYLFAPDDPQAVIDRLAAGSTRIVSLTVTEGGYNFHQVTGDFDESSPDVRHDLEPGAAPRTVFGLVTEALRARRDSGTAPFTVMSCDNIQGNGEVAKRSFVAYATLKDPELGAWIDEHVPFPNSMVDRITPVTSDSDRDELSRRFGVEDAWPVVCEPFFQWVLEDDFPLGRPPFEQADVQVVADVLPYELMKLRLLNVGHQALCYFGYLAGYRYAHEALGDPLIPALLRAYMQGEGRPTLQPVPGVDLDEYIDTLIERFSNPEVRDTLARLCAESSDRIPKWLVPVVRENLAAGGEVRLSAAIVASWARYAEGVDEVGEPIDVVDRLADRLVPIARTQRESTLAFLESRDLFGDLIDDPRFTEPYAETLRSMHERGSRATLEALVGDR